MKNLRITDQDQLATMSPWAQKQLQVALDGCGCEPTRRAPAGIHKPEHTTPTSRRGSAGVKRVNRPEEDAGRLLTSWIDLLVLPSGMKPGLFFMHTPNGLARTAAQGGIFKAQGLRAGWPDYSLDLPIGEYHGLRLELKAENGSKPTAAQLDILARLESVGYRCCVAWGFDDARAQIEKYLGIG